MAKEETNREKGLGRLVLLTYPDTVDYAKEKLKGKNLNEEQEKFLKWLIEHSKKRKEIVEEYLEALQLPGLLGAKKDATKTVDGLIDEKDSKKFLDKELEDLEIKKD